MVSPGTHPVENHVSQSRANESQLSPSLGLYVTRQFNLKTDSKTLYYGKGKLGSTQYRNTVGKND